MTVVELIKWENGQPLGSPVATALLMGVPVEQFDEMISIAPEIPNDWIKQGRRRSAEAMAQTGSDSLVDMLRYWAAKDYNAQVEQDIAGNIFMWWGEPSEQ
jgi:hypothetical protein